MEPEDREVKHAESALEKARAELDYFEEESEALFRAWCTAYYRRVSGELKTNRALDAAREDMEAAVIKAGNAYIRLQEENEIEKPRTGSL
jgi:hypothetical protein